MEGITLTQLNNLLGAYSRVQRMELYNQAFIALEFEGLLTTIDGVSDETTVTSSEIDEVTQPYQGVFTAKGNVEFFPRKFKVRDIKINYKIDDANKVRKSHVSWLADQNLHLKDWPLVRYIYNELLFNKARQENEYIYVWDGLYVAPTAGTAGAAKNNVDGFGTVLAALQTAGEVIPIPIGEITKDNAEAKIREFCDKLPEPFKSMPGEIMVSSQVFGWYHDNYVTTYGTNANFDGFVTQILGRNKTIRPVKAMKSANGIWMTPSWNRKKVMDKTNDFNNLNNEKSHYNVEISCDWSRAYGVIDTRYLFMSDGAITNTAHTETQLKATQTYIDSLAARGLQSSALDVAGTFTDSDSTVWSFKHGWTKTRKRDGTIVNSADLTSDNAEMQHLVDINYGGLVESV